MTPKHCSMTYFFYCSSWIELYRKLLRLFTHFNLFFLFLYPLKMLENPYFMKLSEGIEMEL